MYDGPLVFLSSTGRDLDGYRSAIIKALQTTEFFRVVAQENFGIEATYPRDACAARVQKCDLFVGVVGFYRGGEIEGDNLQRSFTEHEYDTAADNGKPRFIAVVPEDHPMPPMFVSKGEQGDRQEAFRRKALKDSVAGVRFANEDVLALNVINALWKHVFVERELAKASQHATVTPEQARAFEAAAGQLAEEEVIDLAALAKGDIAFDPEATERELRRRADELVADAQGKRKEAAALWRQIGAIAGLGDPKQAREAYAQAASLDPDHIDGMERHASYQRDAGNLAEAERAARLVLNLGKPGTDDRDLFWAGLTLGNVQLARGNLGAASATFHAAREPIARLAEADPGHAGWQRDLSVSHNKIGDVLRAQGNLDGGLNSFKTALAIAERLAKADPGNAGWQRDLSVSHNKIGDVFRAQGNLAAALDEYNASLAIRERLAQSDPGNAGWQRDLSVSHDNIGRVLRAQGNLAAALDAFKASLAIAERLAEVDPGHAGWQRDLSVSHNKIGDVLRDQGDLAGALDAFEAGLAIAERLAQADPGNAAWQRDLSLSHERIGDVLRDQGNLGGALDAFKASLAIRERLAKADPGNAGWQRDLSVSHDRIGSVLEELGRIDEALVHYQKDLEIAERLANLDPSNATWQKDVEISRARMARLKP